MVPCPVRSAPRLRRRGRGVLCRAVGGLRFGLGFQFGTMPRQEDAERGALAGLGIHVDKAAGLLDDAIHRREAKPGALADFLGREERLEDLVDDIGRNAGAGIGDVDPHIIRRRHALVGQLRGFIRRDVGGLHRQLAAVGHRVAGVDREIDDHLLELRDVDLDRPEIAAMHEVELDLLADQPPQQHGEIGQGVAEIEHLRPQRLAAREREQLPHQRRGAGRVLLDLHDVLERRIGRLVRVQQEVVRHHDGGQHVVEVVRDAAGELADHVHLLRLVDLVFQRAPLGGLQQIDDGGFGVALVFLDRGDEELPPALLGAVEHGLDRRDVALPFRGLVDRRDQKAAVARIHRAENRLVGRAVGTEALRQLGEAGIGAHHRAAAVDGRDRHRRMIEEAHEADFGGALADRNARRARG